MAPVMFEEASPPDHSTGHDASPRPSSSGGEGGRRPTSSARGERGGSSKLENPPGVRRQTLEFLILLGLGILVLRTFAAEAYVVPTGSMAPTLVGVPPGTDLPQLPVPVRDRPWTTEGRSARAICPNCGQGWDLGERDGRRVQRRPIAGPKVPLRRPPAEAVGGRGLPEPGIEVGQAYVKRVVGPAGRDDPGPRRRRLHRRQDRPEVGSRSRGRSGILVFDNDFVPADSDRFPALAVPGRPGRAGWQAERLACRRDPVRPRLRSPRNWASASSTGSNITTTTPTARAYGLGPRFHPV